MNIQTVPKIPNRETRRLWSKELRDAPPVDPNIARRGAQDYLRKNVPGWQAKHMMQQSAKMAQADVEQMRQQWYAKNQGQQPAEEEKDYVKEFGDSQQGKTISVKFEPNVKHEPVQELPLENDNSISEKELEEIVTESVLEMMNTMDTPPYSGELLEEQKEEIEGIIKEYCNRPGIMSISFREDLEKDTSEVNALIDPTNKNNWIALREELIYKLPYSYKESLHTFASEVWNKHKFV
jgi:hypothetical protein